MSFINSIEELRKIKADNKLIMFVGAGVSRNSNIPTWGDLIFEFAKRLNYTRCNQCWNNKNECNAENCKESRNFSQDDFLKIPQYFYNKDESIDKEEYFNVIKDIIDVEAESNCIDEIILNLLPKHIITTNYDRLLEKTKSMNSNLYHVVTKDEDLLSEHIGNYIIKMHGDIKELHNIVLKEDDYLQYSHKHILIETFIKSLLIDNSFVFIGYSLNDNNLKMIMSWLEYLAKEKSVEDGLQKHYIITDSIDDKSYLKKYYEKKKIEVIDLNEIPESILKLSDETNLDSIKGKRLYAILKALTGKHSYLDLENTIELLSSKLKVFDEFKKITFTSLINVCGIGPCTKLSNVLILYDDNQFLKLKNLFEQNNDKVAYIKSKFLSANIYAIQDNNNNFIEFEDGENANNEDIFDEYFSLYLNNQYIKLFEKLDNETNNLIATYYFQIILPNTVNYQMSLAKVESEISKNFNLKKFIIYKYNLITVKNRAFQDSNDAWNDFEQILIRVPASKKDAYKFFIDISHGMNKQHNEMKNLLHVHKNYYIKKDNSVQFGWNNYGKLLELQAIAYDYYLFYKYNLLTIDWFSNPKDYLSYYIESIFITYYPQNSLPDNSFWGYNSPRDKYSLEEIDIDMIVKYSNIKDLLRWQSEYGVVDNLQIQNVENLIIKFENLCSSLYILGDKMTYQHLTRFSSLISMVKLHNKDINRILIAISKLIEIIPNKQSIADCVIEALTFILEAFKDSMLENGKEVLSLLCNYDIWKSLKDNNGGTIYKCINLMGKYADEELINNLLSYNDKDFIFYIRNIIPDSKNKQLNKIICKQFKELSSDQIFWYIVNKKLCMSQKIIDNFKNIIEQEIQKRLINSNERSYPDYLQVVLNHVLILHLIGRIKNIKFLQKYMEYSVFIEFIFNPEEFNYSKFDIRDFMWMNFLKNKKYRNFIVNHRNEIVTEDLKSAILNGYLQEKEKKVIYRYFYKEEDIWK